MNFVKKLARGTEIRLEDLEQYKPLQASDVEKKEWQFAPVLVTSNRERMEITRQKAILFAKLHKTCVFKWRNRLTDWKNKIQATCTTKIQCCGNTLLQEVMLS